MFAWLKRLLLGFDRTEAASERAAVALEDIASMLEKARDALQQRLEGPAEETPALPAPTTTTEAAKNGQHGKKKLAGSA
jgi:hypothetical protein